MADIIDLGGGLVPDDAWRPRLPGFDCMAFKAIRSSLLERIDGLCETFNRGPVAYFSYKMSDGPLVLHIYPQVRIGRLIVDVNLDRAVAGPAIRAEGFEIEYRDNFQGQAGWLTGWRIPSDAAIQDRILKWLAEAFDDGKRSRPSQRPKGPQEPGSSTGGADEEAARLLSTENTAALKPRAPSLAEDREIGRSRVVGYLGRGGMGEVYEVEHIRLGKRYALKVILPEHAREAGFVGRLERAARVTARLEHPNIIRVDDFGEDDGLYWIRMELAGGVDAAALLGSGHEGRASSLAALAHAAGGRLPEPVVAEVAGGMLAGLAHAHAGGVVHRDLKPANVLLTEGPGGNVSPKVSDFGLARMIAEADGELGRGEAASDSGTPEQALAHFWRAKTVFESVFKATKPLAECVALASEADNTRDAARESRADGFAPRDFDAAVGAADATARAREAGDFARAGRYFKEAAAAFNLASETALEDAALRDEVLALHAEGIEWRFRDEPAFKRMLEGADSVAAKVEDALSARDRAEAVRLAREAKGLYANAFGLEQALRDCVRVEREARSTFDECVRFDAERHAAGELTGGMGLLEQSRVFRLEGDFTKAGAIAREARDTLRACRDACIRARGRRVSGIAIKMLAFLILATAVIAIIIWGLGGDGGQVSRGTDALPETVTAMQSPWRTGFAVWRSAR